MKRLLAFLLAVLCIASVFAGCKQEEETPVDKIPVTNNDTSTEYDIPVNEELKYDINFEEYITFPELAALELTYNVTAINDEAVNQQIYNLQLKEAARTEITDRAVQDGDIVTINYKAVYYGTQEQFADRSNVEFTIGQNMAIPALEEAIIGMSTGETKTADIVYPADRTTSKVLANAKTTYTIELVKIETADLPELNTETITSFGLEGVDSYEELREYIILWIEEQNSLYKQEALYKALVSGSTLKSMPKAEYDYYTALFDSNTEAAAEATGVSVESYKNTNYQTEEAYETARAKDAQDNVLKDLIIYALKDKYGVEVTKEEYNFALNETYKSEAASLGITTLDDFYDKMGESVYKMELNYQVMEAAAKDVPDKN